MKIFLDCIPCFLRQGLDSARLVTDDEKIHKQVLYDVLEFIRNMDIHQSSPAMARLIHQDIRKLTNNPDPYRQIKQKHNRLALELYDLLRPNVVSADDAFEAAIRLAIAGNIIDLGVKSSVSDEHIQNTINESLTATIDHEAIEQLQEDIKKADQILYLTDNAGEIVFDKLLIEHLPKDKLTIAVKGSPVINDATMDDARQAGLTEMANVIDNGSDGPGTLLDTCSKEFIEQFDKSDLVISKGQGNYESLSGIDKHIYFLLKAKCPVIATDIGCEVGRMIIKKNQISDNVMS